MDADVEAELEDIETMIALEEAGQLPSVPEGEEVLETSEERRERTRKELERMKKEVQE